LVPIDEELVLVSIEALPVEEQLWAEGRLVCRMAVEMPISCGQLNIDGSQSSVVHLIAQKWALCRIQCLPRNVGPELLGLE
jgi:hypothetical protein